MNESFIELKQLESAQEHSIHFTINGTHKTDPCSFRTLKNDKILEKIEPDASFTEIYLNWTTSRDVEFLHKEGYLLYTTYKKLARGEKISNF